jgi:hypothetical protein
MKTVVQPEHAEAQAQEDSLISQFSDWVQQGTENFFGAQRILLDMVMQQNTLAMNALRERLTSTEPGTVVLKEVAGEDFANFIAAQKILLDLARQQNKIVINGVKERVGVSTPAGAMADLLRRSVETFIDLQQHFLDAAAKQGTAWTDTAKTRTGFRSKSFSEFASESMGELCPHAEELPGCNRRGDSQGDQGGQRERKTYRENRTERTGTAERGCFYRSTEETVGDGRPRTGCKCTGG